MDSPDFIYGHLFAKELPEPAARFISLPKYNFIGGHNDPDIIPAEDLARAASSVLCRDGRLLAMYNLGHGPQGYRELREFIVKKAALHRGMNISMEDIVITSGSGQGLDLVNRILVEPGDTILVEEFSYELSIKRAKALGAKLIGIPLDEHGIVVEQLANILEELQTKGILPKYIYTIPTLQNPTGSILPLHRRLKLIEVARHYGVPIFEDECYADLVFAGTAPPALHALAPESVIHIGSFSKNLAPAVRVGYLIAGWEVLSRIIACKADSGTGAINQMVVAEYFKTCFEAHLRGLNRSLAEKLDVMIEALHREFGTAVECGPPEGGIFVWIRFPDTVDTSRLVGPAAAAGLAFNAGTEWAVDPAKGKPFMRLCFALPSKEEIRDGISLLARICFEETGVPMRSANAHRLAPS